MQDKPFVQRNDKNDKVTVYINQSIKAPTIVVLDEDKNNLGSFPRRIALEMAEERGVDLIQMYYDPIKQVCTAILGDYGKYMYKKQKNIKEKKKAQKQKGLKELKISYSIGDNDLELKIKKGREFLNDGYNVKYFIKLRGREKIYEEKAFLKLKGIVSSLEDAGRTQYPDPKKEVRGYSVILFSKI